jgi:ribonuclease HI
MKKIICYTDGSAKNNPGIGGWGWISYIHKKGRTDIEITDWGGEDKTTNVKMEMTGLLKCLRYFSICKNIEIKIYCDNQMCIKTLVGDLEFIVEEGYDKPRKSKEILIQLDEDGKPQGWMKNWFNENWNENRSKYWNSDRKNGDIWIEIHQILLKHHKNKNRVKLAWCRGHSGIKGNEKADKLANKYYKNISCESLKNFC